VYKSFACPTGPNQIIQHGINGLLVPSEDKDRLKEVLHSLMVEKEMRVRMGKKASSVSKQYDPDKIMEQWERLAFGEIRR